jgi:catechol 2,3-dioxygenase-like lactoylglutathione lyase family enzyme
VTTRDADRRKPIIKGLAHTGVCVPDVEAAVAWYRDVLGLTVLSPPYLMGGEALRRDMGELVERDGFARAAAAAATGADAGRSRLSVLIRVSDRGRVG